MTELLGWVKNLAVYLIFSELLFQILPHKRYRKYLRFFSGLILVLLILSPLLSAGGLEQRLLDAMDSFSQIQSSDEMEDVMAQAEAAREQGLSGEYEAILESRVEEMVEQEGYRLASFSAELCLDPEAENFGEIYSMTAVLRQEGQEEEGGIRVEPVVIGEGKKEVEPELAGLTEELGGILGIEPEKITLSLRE